MKKEIQFHPGHEKKRKKRPIISGQILRASSAPFYSPLIYLCLGFLILYAFLNVTRLLWRGKKYMCSGSKVELVRSYAHSFYSEVHMSHFPYLIYKYIKKYDSSCTIYRTNTLFVCLINLDPTAFS